MNPLSVCLLYISVVILCGLLMAGGVAVIDWVTTR
jgi:hypothetical protein